MTNKIIFGILYVSIWIVTWGSVASLIDLPLLNADIYIPGSLGQFITFSITGTLSTIIALIAFPIINEYPLIKNYIDK
tara:strand:- start:65 stop:298 length:234 start_codon:yes stop_codon:yes gene_type:complete